jgi:hypothetical protein
VQPRPRPFDLIDDIERLDALIRPQFTALSEAIERTVHETAHEREASPLRQTG